MIKKAIIGSVAAALLAGFVFGRDACSYVSTFGSEIRDAVKSEIDVEFEVQRARKLVENLVPEIHKCLSVVAEQQVEVREMRTEIADKELALRAQQDKILVLRDDLSSGDDTFVYASHSYSRDAVKRDLNQRFERFKAADDAVKRDRQILAAREQSLQANEESLQSMLTQKQDLEVQIAQLEARLKTVQAAETVSSLEIDNSQLTRAKQLIREINKQLDVKEALLDAEGRFTGLIPVDTEQPESVDVTEKIDAYFGVDNSDHIEIVDAEPSA